MVQKPRGGRTHGPTKEEFKVGLFNLKPGKNKQRIVFDGGTDLGAAFQPLVLVIEIRDIPSRGRVYARGTLSRGRNFNFGRPGCAKRGLGAGDRD